MLRGVHFLVYFPCLPENIKAFLVDLKCSNLNKPYQRGYMLNRTYIYLPPSSIKSDTFPFAVVHILRYILGVIYPSCRWNIGNRCPDVFIGIHYWSKDSESVFQLWIMILEPKRIIFSLDFQRFRGLRRSSDGNVSPSFSDTLLR